MILSQVFSSVVQKLKLLHNLYILYGLKNLSAVRVRKQRLTSLVRANVGMIQCF